MPGGGDDVGDLPGDMHAGPLHDTGALDQGSIGAMILRSTAAPDHLPIHTKAGAVHHLPRPRIQHGPLGPGHRVTEKEDLASRTPLALGRDKVPVIVDPSAATR